MGFPLVTVEKGEMWWGGGVSVFLLARSIGVAGGSETVDGVLHVSQLTATPFCAFRARTAALYYF